MRRSLSGFLACVLVAVALAGAACGRYGPPVRRADPGAAPPPPPITDPVVDPDDPVVPGPKEP